ncbi:hypothetical protein PENTCL1PPCAC_15216, partial [Pristionchus entomophagus]
RTMDNSKGVIRDPLADDTGARDQARRLELPDISNPAVPILEEPMAPDKAAAEQPVMERHTSSKAKNKEQQTADDAVVPAPMPTLAPDDAPSTSRETTRSQAVVTSAIHPPRKIVRQMVSLHIIPAKRSKSVLPKKRPVPIALDDASGPAPKKTKGASGLHVVKKEDASSSQKGKAATTKKNKSEEIVYSMLRPKKNMDGTIMVDEEVENRGHETVKDMVAQTERAIEEAEKNGTGEPDWPIAFILCPSLEHPAKKNEDPKPTRIIVKYHGFPIPSFLNVVWWFNWSCDPMYAKYWERHKRLHMIEVVVRSLLKKDYLTCYPYRLAPDEEGYELSEFVENKITLHKLRVRVAEWRFTFECDTVNLPPILCEDWTGTVDGRPFPFKWTNFLMPSKKVVRAMRQDGDFGSFKCNGAHGCAKDSKSACDSLLINRNPMNRRCDGCVLITSTKSNESTIDKTPLECCKQCACDVETCGNRVVQKGRQHIFIIFKHHRKGFVVLAYENITKGTFCGEYTGEVITAHEALLREDQSYQMEMPYVRAKRDDVDGKKRTKTHRKLVIDAINFGNETRFVSHSCSPNLAIVPVYVERYGGHYNRMAFVANRDIAIGEELTIDYRPHLKLENKEKNNPLPFFENCLCGNEENCKFKKRSEKELVELRKGAAEEAKKRANLAEEDEDSYSEGESDEEDEETKRKKKSMNDGQARRDRASKRWRNSSINDEELVEKKEKKRVAKNDEEKENEGAIAEDKGNEGDDEENKEDEDME